MLKWRVGKLVRVKVWEFWIHFSCREVADPVETRWRPVGDPV